MSTANAYSGSQHYRWLVVGGGAAGCLLASSLAALDQGQVGLVEAGPRSRRARTNVPAWYLRTQGTAIDWAYRTEPQTHLGGRALAWPRGKCLGGSTAINAMIYMLPARADLQRWEEITGRQWSLTCDEQRVAQRARGGEGRECELTGLPLAPVAELHPWCRMFLEAAEATGLERDSHWYQSQTDLCGPYWLTTRNGQRVAADELVRPQAQAAQPSANPVELLTDAFVSRVLLEGSRAIGVELISASGRVSQLTSDETILCSGAIGTPAILERSGIGAAEQLKRADIRCAVDLPGVGENLQDHLVLPFIFQIAEPVAERDACTGLPSRFDASMRRAYREAGRGPLASNLAEAGAMLGAETLGVDVARAGQSASRSDFDEPRVQLHVTPTHYLKYPQTAAPRDCMTVAVTPLHPVSRGYVHVSSKEPIAAPRIDPKYLSAHEDLEIFTAAASWLDRLRRTEVFARSGAELILPKPSRLGPEGIARQVRGYALSIYHPVGSCRMGSDERSVVDAQFRVHGIENLRVGDVSVLPYLPSGNTAATAFLIAKLVGASVRRV